MFISCWQLTWDDLTSCLAAAPPADNYYDIILDHDCCMGFPLFAEKGIEMRDVDGWECQMRVFDLKVRSLLVETWE